MKCLLTQRSFAPITTPSLIWPWGAGVYATVTQASVLKAQAVVKSDWCVDVSIIQPVLTVTSVSHSTMTVSGCEQQPIMQTNAKVH